MPDQTATETSARAYAVRRLSIASFRSYEGAQAEIDARPVALTGPNGAGKTNILEAVSLLSPGRGLRGAPLAASARTVSGEAPKAWRVAAIVEGPDGTLEIGTGLAEGADGMPLERRLVRLNGAPASSAAALSETFRVLWLTPAMDRLFIEGASGRRRFLDRMTLAFEPSHARHAAAYEKAMRERLKLLKEGRAERAWLDALEARMAADGLALAAARARTAERLKADLVPGDGDAFPSAQIAIAGSFEESRLPGDAGEARFREQLAQRRRSDADSGRTGFGPHTADLDVVYAAKGRAAAECSTGEQKALLIGLVLAAARAQAREGGTPVLLLDEIAAHLDARRRAALFDAVSCLGAQAWMTGADIGLFDGLGERAQGFRIEAGALLPARLA